MDGGLRGLPKLEHLLQFTCGSPFIPSNGKKINVQFTMGDLPDPDACFGILKLPLNHLTLNKFMKNMNIAINCQHKDLSEDEESDYIYIVCTLGCTINRL